MSYESSRPPFSVGKLIAGCLLLIALTLVVPTFYGIWIPDIGGGEELLIAGADTTNRVLRFRLTQKLDGLNGYTRQFSYTLDDRRWYGMEVGTRQSKLWDPRMESSVDCKRIKIFDRDKECIRIEWSSERDRYEWLKSNGALIVTRVFSIPDPTPGH